MTSKRLPLDRSPYGRMATFVPDEGLESAELTAHSDGIHLDGDPKPVVPCSRDEEGLRMDWV